MRKSVFVVWSPFSRRSETLAETLPAKIFLIKGNRKIFPLRFYRYLIQGWQTFKILHQEKPEIIFVENPPIYAVLFVFLFAKFHHRKFIIDSSTRPFIIEKWYHRLFLAWHHYFSRHALLTLLHNEELVQFVRSWKINWYVLEDGIPYFKSYCVQEKRKKMSVGVICSFSSDEPIEEILEATHKIPEVHFHLTGDKKKLNVKLKKKLSSNVTLTGFLPDEEYIKLLQSVEVIMVLTTRPHTLLCGAYEAVAVGKPLITSDLPLLRHHFYKGTVYVKNTAEAISQGITKIFPSYHSLKRKMVELNEEKERNWQEKIKELKKIILQTREGPL
ncbi:MAG: glycosyltransferase [Candidatus Edwardsbacteria bacterium]